MPPTKTLTPARQILLHHLGQDRHLTTAQLHQSALPQHSYSYTYQELVALREMGLVTSHRSRPRQGAASTFYWLLTRTGVAQCVAAPYGPKTYRKRPTSAQLAQQQTARDLEARVHAAGWALLRPVTYSRVQPKPTLAQMLGGQPTPQVQTLTEVIAAQEQRAIEGAVQRDPHNPALVARQADYRAKLYESAVYAAAPNDYMAYRLAPHARAIILILCPDRAGERFWRGRIARYSRLVRYVKIYAVFADPAAAMGYETLLGAAGFAIRSVESIGQSPAPAATREELHPPPQHVSPPQGGEGAALPPASAFRSRSQRHEA